MLSRKKYMPEGRLPTREDLKEASQSSPILAHALLHVRHKTMTEDQAILWALFAALDQADSMLENLCDVTTKGLPPIVLQCPDPSAHQRSRP